MAIELVQPAEDAPEEPRGDLAVMLTGGGARAAYQVGLLKGLARHFPRLRFPIITGVSAGAINAIFLAANEGQLRETAELLVDVWLSLECRHVFRPNYAALLPFRSALSAILPAKMARRPHGFLNAGPLAETLRRVYHCPAQPSHRGIRRNLARGDLKAGGPHGARLHHGTKCRWAGARRRCVEGPNRRGEQTEITVEHACFFAPAAFVFQR
jgi:NTE family protein